MRRRLTAETTSGLGTTSRSPLVLAVQRLLLRTSGTPLDRLWTAAYRAVAHAVLALLLRGDRRAAGYARGSLGGGDTLPGLSDIDLAVVADDPERLRERWARLERALPALPLLVDTPRLHGPEELRAARGASTLTYAGLAYTGASRDLVRMLERPELDGGSPGWRHLRGPDRRPAPAGRDAHATRIACWLELVYFWRWAFPVCADASGPRGAVQCVNVAAGAGRTWLVLHGRTPPRGRAAVLHTLLDDVPEHEPAVRRLLDTQATLARRPAPPVAEALEVLLALSHRIAARVQEELSGAPVTEVELVGTTTTEPLPLADWRALVCPPEPDETLRIVGGDPADPAVLAAVAAGSDGPEHPALLDGDLLLLPALGWLRTRMRTIQCPVTDPVSFALLRGERVARFPRVPGWSAEDLARRATAETPGARAELLHRSLRDGAPRLALTTVDARSALGRAR